MLTDTQIKKLKPKEKAYQIADANSLVIEISPKGKKVFKYRYRFNGKAQSFRIGEYPIIGLAKAREMRDDAKTILVQGVDPNQHSQSIKIEQQLLSVIAEQMTFKELFELWHKQNLASWQLSTSDDIRERIENHLLPSLGALPLEAIKPMDLIKALMVVEQGGRVETTRRVKQYANRIFKFGIGFGHCEVNPVANLPDDIFLKADKQNYAHTTDPKVLAQILKAIENYAGDISTIKALELAPMIFLRSKEIAGIRWDEIDLETKLIAIPPERMKKKRAHLVPLSSQAIEIIEYMKPISGDCDFLFPSTRTKSRPLGEQTLNPALHRLGFKGIQTFHGFRHTASTMLNEMGYMGDVVEKQLSHEESNKVRGAYNKAQYLTQRKVMMQGWSDYLNGLKTGG
jgi:integrase